MWIKGQSETRSTPSALHSSYTLYYENEEKIESIIGVNLPNYTTRGNTAIHDIYLTNWIGIETLLRFDSVLEPTIYVILDSLCNLSIPHEIPDNTSFVT